MASLIDVSGLTLNTEEAKEISKLIIEKFFVNGNLSDIHDIETGVTHKMQIPFAGRIADALKKSTGCTPNEAAGVAFTQKIWDPEIYDARWEHCAADLNILFKLFQKAARINPDFYDRIDSQEMGLIVSLIEQMLMETLPIKIWFSNKTVIAADMTTGVDLDLYNVIDGLFKQIFAEVGSGDDNYVEITQNAGISYAAQALPTDAAVGYLAKVMNQADSRLLADPTAQLLVTRSIADNYRNTLRNKTLGAGFMEVTENGRPQLYFDGYKVVTMDMWDREIKANFDDGTVLDKPHRIVFTTPANIPVATTSTDDFDTLDSFYDRYKKVNVVDVAFSLDAKHLEPYMTVAAY
jgi:hypothetical protein